MFMSWLEITPRKGGSAHLEVLPAGILFSSRAQIHKEQHMT